MSNDDDRCPAFSRAPAPSKQRRDASCPGCGTRFTPSRGRWCPYCAPRACPKDSCGGPARLEVSWDYLYGADEHSDQLMRCDACGGHFLIHTEEYRDGGRVTYRYYEVDPRDYDELRRAAESCDAAIFNKPAPWNRRAKELRTAARFMS